MVVVRKKVAGFDADLIVTSRVAGNVFVNNFGNVMLLKQT